MGLKIQNASWTSNDMDEWIGLAASHGSGVAGAGGKLSTGWIMDSAALCQENPLDVLLLTSKAGTIC